MVGGKLKVTFIYCDTHVWAMSDGSSAKTRLQLLSNLSFPNLSLIKIII